MAEQSHTLNALSATWEGVRGGFTEDAPSPRLRILYHANLARIGHLSEPDIPLTAGEWQVVGRKQPLFLGATPGAPAHPLEDPTISREQLRIRWLPDDGLFELATYSKAKRRVRVLDAAGALQPILTTARLPPDTHIAIGDRLMLALEVTRYRAPENDRMQLVGESDIMWTLRDDIAEVAAFAGATLILGETGTGKELVAHALHRRGERAEAPFLIVNCAALPHHLVESLLFGHIKGAFTGASSDRAGQFRAADGGTLFLDELGEMPIGVQPKLLRTLEDGHVSPVGDTGSTKVDVRLIAATNREPREEIAAGRWREDLYHRVARHVVRIPPLSARRGDIPELFVHFLGQIRAQRPSLNWMWEHAATWHRSIPMSFFVALMHSDFLGNVRELRNLAERTARRNLHPGPFRAPELPDVSVTPTSRAQTSPIVEAPPAPELLAVASRALGLAQKTVAKLLPAAELARIHARAAGDASAATTNERDAERATDIDQRFATALTAYAADRLRHVLSQHNGIKSKAAAVLGVSPTTMAKLIAHFELS